MKWVTGGCAEALSVEAPADITVSNDAGKCSPVVDPGIATAKGCPPVNVVETRSDGQILGAPYPV